jgi:hypothetical protein
MFSELTRALVLMAAAALVANAQCYGICAVNTSDSDRTQPGSCHRHNQPSHTRNTGCANPHPEFSGPEVGIAKADVAPGRKQLPATLTFAIASGAFVRVAAPQRIHWAQADPGPPSGGRIKPGTSVLRI